MWNIAWPAQQPSSVREIDDYPLRSSQPGRSCLRAKKRCAQIRVERGVPDLLCRGNHARRQKIRRAIHQNVEPPKMFPRIVEQSLDFPDATQVRPNGHRSPPAFFNFLDGIFGLSLRIPVMDHHVRAFFRQPQRHRAPQSLPRPRHQSDLPSKRLAFSPGSLRHGSRRYHSPTRAKENARRSSSAPVTFPARTSKLIESAGTGGRPQGQKT